MQSKTITTEIRVVSETLKTTCRSTMDEKHHPEIEILEVKAVGEWGEHRLPVSLHFAMPPGYGTIPFTGSKIKLEIEIFGGSL
jgi:hypothetical protein